MQCIYYVFIVAVVRDKSGSPRPSLDQNQQ